MFWLRSSAVLFCLTILPVVALAKPDAPTTPPVDRPLMGGAHSTLTSSGTGVAARETAGPDTFVLYGGPDHPTQGKFQLANGVTADWGGGNELPGGYGGGPGAWTPVDNTFELEYWHLDTFNAQNLNSNGAGNHAMWAGLPAGDPDTAGWSHSQGYGNGWSTGLIYESETLADPGAGQVVTLDGFLNYQTELDYDFVRVEFLRGFEWVEAASASGTNAGPGDVFDAPGVSLASIQTAPIEYFGDDYGYSAYGGGGMKILIRIRFTSDGAWSDEDGLFTTTAGAAQVDDLMLTYSEGSFFENFEGGGPYLWHPDQRPFFGDFADVYPQFSDLDPCRENPTPVIGFLDYDQIVRNGPGTTGRIRTGGEPYLDGPYGIPGSWATNHSGGLDRLDTINNSIISPEIPVDLAGTGDDDPGFAGLTLSYDVLEDRGGNPPNGAGEIWHSWSVRSALPGEAWGDWASNNFVYGLHGKGDWMRRSLDLASYVEPGADRIQVRLTVVDLCEFTFGCAPYSAPAPVFDNVTVTKYRLAGPVISVRYIDLAQDGFPVNQSIDVSTPGSRGSLDCPFSMARDISSGDLNAPGDSIIVDVTPMVPGTTVTDLRMVWALATNPLFEDAVRSAPGRPVDENVTAGAAGTIWGGEVVGSVSTTQTGTPVDGRWFFDLPDMDLMYPGDVLHYYIQTTDSDGRVSTLPPDLSGFGSFGASSTWARQFTVRALPTISDTAGTQPSLLVINDFWYGEAEAPLLSSLAQLGFAEGVDYDTYTVQGPVSDVGNGIGSYGAHGATAAQLNRYSDILYLTGELVGGLSDEVYSCDSCDDISLLTDWHGLGGTRNIAYFGDNLASSLDEGSSAAQTYLANVMGVQVIGADVRDAIGNQTAPVVVPNPAWAPQLTTSFVAYGGCLQINRFDQIRPGIGATAGHYFTDSGGTPLIDAPVGVASVVQTAASGYDITVPFSLSAITDVVGRSTGPAARTAFLGEILTLFGSGGGSAPVAAPARIPVQLTVQPNPFNPRTVVHFTGVIGRQGAVQVFNLRGELVRELQRGEFTTTEFVWDGTDGSGASVASGVYVVRADADGTVKTAKVALVR